MSFDWRQYTILVVEDDQDLLDIMSEIFQTAGAKVLTAKNGKLALDIVNVQRIDFVVSDIQMPVLDGIQLLKKIRAMNPKVPIVLLATGQAQIEEHDALNMGAVGIIRKPFTFEALLEAVQKVLETNAKAS